MVRPYPCLRASKLLSASSITTSKPLRWSATAVAAPPIPPPATTMQPHAAGSTEASVAADAAAAAAESPAAEVASPGFLSCLRRLTIRCCPGALEKAHSALSRSSSLNLPATCSAHLASAAKSRASSWPALANDHAMVARSDGPKSFARCSADRASAAKSATRSDDDLGAATDLEKAHATLAMCGASSSSRRRATSDFTSAPKSAASVWPTRAKAHAVLTRSWTLNSSTQRSAARASDANSCASMWHALASAHAVLARSCELNSLRLLATEEASAAKSFGSA
mmetsp:Transcript_23363/g.76045  ORF Transcript_23363/g.76045 Transcript_23363/m.76045 type:complete len:282 (+) Transcript_23363:939-1784(+)